MLINCHQHNDYWTTTLCLEDRGFGEARYILSPTKTRLVWLSINKERRKQGWGRKLLEHGLVELQRRGYERVVLYALPEAVGFYEKLPYCCRHRTTSLSGLVKFCINTHQAVEYIKVKSPD